MNFKRFGRLNKKRLDNVIGESTIPYDMSRLFPFLTTRPLSMDQRHTISSFKTQSKKFRYCYELFDSCIAEIKRHGHRGFEECIEINNKLFVFTNISPFEIDSIDCELIFDRDAKIVINKYDDIENNLDIVSNVLAELKVRRYPKEDIERLKSFLLQLQTVPVSYEDIPQEYKVQIKESLYTEFRWRCLLTNTTIYSINQMTDIADNKTSNIQEIELKKIKVKIEDSYSILKPLNRYYSIDCILRYFDRYKNQLLKLEQFKEHNVELSYKLLASKLNENEEIQEWIELADNYEEFQSVINEKMNDMKTILNNYIFLNDEHSRQYKHFFNKHRKILSKWQTQQVMRKYRQELSQLQNQFWSLDWDIDEIKEYSDLLLEAKDMYLKNLGDNKIANEGYGYHGDGWSNDITDDDNEDYDVVNDVRVEEKWQRERELEEFEEEQMRIQEELEKESFENED